MSVLIFLVADKYPPVSKEYSVSVYSFEFGINKVSEVSRLTSVRPELEFSIRLTQESSELLLGCLKLMKSGPILSTEYMYSTLKLARSPLLMTTDDYPMTITNF